MIDDRIDDRSIPEEDKVKHKIHTPFYDREWVKPNCPPGEEYVKGYRRPDGIYVPGYCRKKKGFTERFGMMDRRR